MQRQKFKSTKARKANASANKNMRPKLSLNGKGMIVDKIRNDFNLSTGDLIIAATSVTTSTTSFELEDPMVLASTGQWVLFPQVFSPYMAGVTGVLDFVGRVKYRALELRLNLVGSQTNTFAAADLYNRVRVVVFWTKTPFTANVNINALTVDNLLDRRDVDILFLDKVYNLPSQTIDPAGYNAPQCLTCDLEVDLSMIPVQEVFSTANGATWDTREGSFYLKVVSDSAATPHPTIAGQSRLYYKILK